MPIPSHPSNARVTRDVRFYRAKIDADPNVESEVKDNVHGKNAIIFPTLPTKAQVKKYKAYQVFAYHQDPSNVNLPHRLGGGLDQNRPANLAKGKVPEPKKGTVVIFTHPDLPLPVNITVLADGTIVHKDALGKELPDAHHYLHAIFDDLLYTTRDLLEAINEALEDYADDNSATNATAYGDALFAFEDFLANLQPGGSSPYSGAFNSVGIDPVVTNEGFIVSCRMKMNWKNPYHSSSAIKIP